MRQEFVIEGLRVERGREGQPVLKILAEGYFGKLVFFAASDADYKIGQRLEVVTCSRATPERLPSNSRATESRS